MPSERVIKLTHTVLFTLVLLASIISLGISASLVAHYNSQGYPPVHSGGYRDRIRIILVAAVWTTFFAIALIVGFAVAGTHRVFGVIPHLVAVAIGWILFLIGTSSLTALTDKIDCGRASDAFSRCGIVKGLVVVSWIDTIFLTLTLAFIVVLAIRARKGYGLSASLYDA